MLRALLVLLLCSSAASVQSASAQSVRVHAFADHSVVGDGEVVTYTIELEGGFRSVDRVDDPVTRGLVATHSFPSQQRSITQRDGDIEQRIRLEWQYRPSRTGTATIGPTVLIVDGRRVIADEVSVEVVPQAQRPPPGSAGSTPPDDRLDAYRPDDARDLFLTAVPERRTAYVGQQVLVDFELYFADTVQPRNARVGRAWDVVGFWREDLDLGRDPPARRATVEGLDMHVATIKRSALFPTRAGTLSAEAFVVDVDVLRSARSGGSLGRFYNPFGARFERETVTAPAIPITVRPLPSGAPSGFAGAVGDFSMRVELDRAEMAPGEPARVTVTLRGDGNLALLDAPTWTLPPPFEVYPAQAETSLQRTGDRLVGERRFGYTVVASQGGRFELPPFEWAYFDPEAEAYRILASDTLRLNVVGPAAPLAEAAPPAASEARLHTEPGAWQRVRARRPFYARPLVLGLFVLPLLGLLALLGVRRVRDHQQEKSPLERRLRAFPAAESALRDAEVHRERQQVRAFHAAIERAVRRFLSDRLGVDAGPLSADQIDVLLHRHGVTESTCEALLDVLAACREGQFAAVPPPIPPRATESVTRVLTSVDAEARSEHDEVSR